MVVLDSHLNVLVNCITLYGISHKNAIIKRNNKSFDIYVDNKFQWACAGFREIEIINPQQNSWWW